MKIFDVFFALGVKVYPEMPDVQIVQLDQLLFPPVMRKYKNLRAFD